MKTVLFALCVVCASLYFVGCSKDETPTNSNNNNNNNNNNNSSTTYASATIDGGTTFTIPIGANAKAIGNYIQSENAVTCVISDGTKSFSVNVYGGTLGTFQFLNIGNADTRWGQISFGSSFTELSGSLPGQGSVIITKYGAVGEKIEGTFSGKFMTSKGVMIDVTNGTFSVTRAADIQ